MPSLVRREVLVKRGIKEIPEQPTDNMFEVGDTVRYSTKYLRSNGRQFAELNINLTFKILEKRNWMIGWIYKINDTFESLVLESGLEKVE